MDKKQQKNLVKFFEGDHGNTHIDITKTTFTIEVSSSGSEFPRALMELLSGSDAINIASVQDTDPGDGLVVNGRRLRSIFEKELWAKVLRGSTRYSAKYSAESKFSALMDLNEGGHYKEVADRYGVIPTTLLGWKRSHLDSSR